MKSNAPSYTAVFGHALTDEAARDPRVVAITAAMPSGTGLDNMATRFAGRVFEIGIAEQHGVTFAAGLAASGMRPLCAIYSTFLQRGYDQIVHDVALQNLPVRFAIDRAGLVGQDGARHAGPFDVRYLSNLPNFTVMAAGDEAELVHMVTTAIAHDAGPVAFRFPRSEGVGVELPVRGVPLAIGKGRVMREAADVAILSSGAHVLHYLANCGRPDGGLSVRTMTLPDRFIDQASPAAMYAEAGLTAADMARVAASAMGQHRPGRARPRLV